MNTELLDRLETRLDRIEQKLDQSLDKSNKNETELQWVKGYIKTSLSLFLTGFIGIISYIFNTFKHG